MVAIVGPTGSGKSELAMALARQGNGEIVNADAFQFYRGMDIGTAKPSAADQAAVPHHCVDFLDVTEPASLAQYQQRARAAIRDIHQRGRLPVVVGGSALYVRATCDVLEIPPSDPAVRARLEEAAQTLGWQQMYDRLRQADPAAAEHIQPRNIRRVVRALEVIELTGSFRSRMPPPQPWRPTLWVSPQWDRADLDDRIRERAHVMWDTGLLDEVARLLANGLANAPTASKAVGYHQAMAELAGEMTRAEAIEATITATRKLARRQERTFRADPRVRPIAGVDPATAWDMVTSWLARPGPVN